MKLQGFFFVKDCCKAMFDLSANKTGVFTPGDRVLATR